MQRCTILTRLHRIHTRTIDRPAYCFFPIIKINLFCFSTAFFYFRPASWKAAAGRLLLILDFSAGAMGAKKWHIITMSTQETPTRDRLVFEAGRIINILKTLEACPMFETSEKHPGKIRESAAGRMYRQYMSMLISVYKALDISGAPEADISPLREYLASRGKGGDNGNA